MAINGSLPQKQNVANEKRDGLMSAKDKKNLNILIKQMAEVLKTLTAIPKDKLTRSSADILINDTKYGKVELNGNIVSLNINLTHEFTGTYQKLFILPKEYAPTAPLSFIVPIISKGVTNIEIINIGTDGTVLCKASAGTGIINTSVSYIK